MIDTDKYEGHTKGKWTLKEIEEHDIEWTHHLLIDNKISALVVKALHNPCEWDEHEANALLMADAPLLLEEVKRLREQVKDLEYEVEHWKWELQTRMCPIEFDALVNGDEEE